MVSCCACGLEAGGVWTELAPPLEGGAPAAEGGGPRFSIFKTCSSNRRITVRAHIYDIEKEGTLYIILSIMGIHSFTYHQMPSIIIILNHNNIITYRDLGCIMLDK